LARGGELLGGHAYPEVYIGKIDSANYWRIRGWLRERYGEVYIHINETTKDAWLNLDWGDGESPNHPGGPFFEADENIPLYISPKTTPKPLQMVNEPPSADFGLLPEHPDVGEIITFDASNCSDPDENIRDYIWEFGDDGTGSGLKAEHAYDAGGPYQVNLTVVDREGLNCSASETIVINWLPLASFSISPEEPEVGELITFDGSASSDPEDSPLVYSWNLSGATVTGMDEATRTYHERGNYTAELTVTDEQGAKGTISRTFKVNEPPRAEIAYSATGDGAPTTGENITFDGSDSCDADGRIIEWVWEFDDGRTDSAESVFHSFESGGEHSVTLRVKDENGSIGEASERIQVNWRPVARFTFDPPNPSVSETIAFNASESCDKETGALRYRWDFDDGSSGGDRWTIPHIYLLSGYYNVNLTVTDSLGASNSTVQTIHVSPANGPPKALSLSPDRDTAEAGSSITWIAEASDPDGDAILYMFLLDGIEVRGWGEDATWTWQTAPYDAGRHTAEVRIRDGRHEGPEGWDDHTFSTHAILSEPTQHPAPTGLQPDISSSEEELMVKGATLYAMGQYEEALQAFDEALWINPYNIDAWTDKGVALSELGRYEEALQAYGEALKINPDYAANTWLNKGGTLIALGRYDEAVEACDMAIRIYPDYGEAWFNKGVALYNMGRIDEAVEAADEAIRIDPLFGEAWNRFVGVIY
ncbi:MAG: PKD domain-containing protein, partial [Methanotrichaceae archaeon]|nr:PKD domain-containing protein [Methanotrichaceae archaeon]